jgi:anti-sigma regulatory factor (Ser/Thr protein kinase)
MRWRGPCKPKAARASIQLHHAHTSARAARRFVAATLHRWGVDALIEVAVLLAGELVTNAIVHAPAAPVGLVVCYLNPTVRVEVHDHSPQPPTQDGPAGWDDEDGRGLGLVTALATRWGVEVDPQRNGKAIWFEIHTG